MTATAHPAVEGPAGSEGPSRAGAPSDDKAPEAGAGTGAKGAKGAKGAQPAKGAKGAKGGQPKKKKLPKILMLVVVLAGVGFVAKGKLVKPHYKPGQQAPDGQVLSLSDPSSDSSALTTSLSDGHLVQVAIDLQLTTVASTKKITNEVPQFLDAAVSVLSTQTYAGLLTPSGQMAAKDEILLRVQQIAGRSEGAEQISAVYFDSLVVQ